MHNMKTLQIISVSITVAIIAVIITLLCLPKQTHGESFTGSASVQVTASTTIVGPGVQQIFPAKIGCTARVISTVDGTGTGIRFITGDSASFVLSSTTLTNVVGLHQAGSTTVTYNSGTNGCGRWFAIATASTTVTLVEYQ